MAAAAAAASGQAVLFVDGKARSSVVRFLQTSPAIATLRTVGVEPSVVATARRV
jgi:hypothetical protein